MQPSIRGQPRCDSKKSLGKIFDGAIPSIARSRDVPLYDISTDGGFPCEDASGTCDNGGRRLSGLGTDAGVGVAVEPSRHQFLRDDRFGE